MRKKISGLNQILLLITALNFIYSPNIHADELKTMAEKEKALKVKALLAKHPLHLYADTKGKRRVFCQAFYEALRTASPKINYIEPVLRTDDPKHPELAKYLSCNSYTGERGPETFTLELSLGTRGFRLYRLDMDNNPKNGLEEYLYAQEPIIDNNGADAASYSRVQFDTCERLDGAGFSVENPTDSRFFDQTGINALIKFRGKYYVYDIGKGGSYNISGNLWAYNARQRRFYNSPPVYCSWDNLRSFNPKNK